MFSYVTGDKIGLPTGGGKVTQNESDALSELGQETGNALMIRSRDELAGGSDPWGWDEVSYREWQGISVPPTLAHFYAGSFGKTVAHLKSKGCKISYTIAAHDVEISRKEHLALGLPFAYNHLTDQAQFQQYIAGYKLADVIVAPGKAPMETMRRQGITNRIEIIPHGCTLPSKISPLPEKFRVGYLGSYGADKGVKYLLQAWKKLNYHDAVLVLGGKDSLSPWVGNLIDTYGGGKIVRVGWVAELSNFYNSLSLYLQPSTTEGFGLEVLESMAYGRPVLCSENAGAADLVPESWRFKACDADALAEKIEFYRNVPHLHHTISLWNRKQAESFTWEKIRGRYKALWASLLQ